MNWKKVLLFGGIGLLIFILFKKVNKQNPLQWIVEQTKLGRKFTQDEVRQIITTGIPA